MLVIHTYQNRCKSNIGAKIASIGEWIRRAMCASVSFHLDREDPVIGLARERRS